MKEQFPIIGDIRGIGLLWAIELVTNKNTKVKKPLKRQKTLCTIA
jgi:4-aminobutyrate aminotransferase